MVSLRDRSLRCGGAVNNYASMGPATAGPAGPPAMLYTPMLLHIVLLTELCNEDLCFVYP